MLIRRSKSPKSKKKSPRRSKSPKSKKKSPRRSKSPKSKKKSPRRSKSPKSKKKSPRSKKKSPRRSKSPKSKKKSLFRFTADELTIIHNNGRNPDDFSMMSSEPQNTAYQTIFKKEYENYLDVRNVLNPLAPLVYFGGGINGLLYRIPYTQPQGLVKNCVLKCGGNRVVDNLLYEFLVGAYAINNLIERRNLTCFIRTYGLFKFKSVLDHREMVVNVQAEIAAAAAAAAANVAAPPIIPPTATQLLKALSLQRLANRNMSPLVQNEIQRYTCDNNALYACMIENIPQVSISLNTFLRSPETGAKYINLIGIFSQIYMQLSMIQNSFTHHDLHGENIMLYDGGPRCFQFTGVVNAGAPPFSFKCRYLVKLIDYGRCSFNVPQVGAPNVTSEDIIDFLNGPGVERNPALPVGGNPQVNCGIGVLALIRNNNPCPDDSEIRNCRGPNLFSDSLMYINTSKAIGGYTPNHKNQLANTIQNQLTNALYPLNNGVAPVPGGVARNTFIEVLDNAFFTNKNVAMLLLNGAGGLPSYGDLLTNVPLATDLQLPNLALRFHNMIIDNRYTRLSDWVFQNVPINDMRWQ